MSGTSDIVCRGCPKEVVRAVKVEAAKRGMTFKDLVVETLREAFALAEGKGYFRETAKRVRKGAAEAASGSDVDTRPDSRGAVGGPPEMAPTNFKFMKVSTDITDEAKLEIIPGEKCSCGAEFYKTKHPTTGVVKWKCLGNPTHTITPREGK